MFNLSAARVATEASTSSSPGTCPQAPGRDNIGYIDRAVTEVLNLVLACPLVCK
jgi:hypothetical protein